MLNHAIGGGVLSLSSSDFELFGIAAQFQLDTTSLSQTWKQLQKQVHPDRFVALGDADKRLAMQWSVRVNEAYERLKQPIKRAAYLCELRGVPVNAEQNTQMPAEFLLQQMQWRESLEDCLDEPSLAMLQQQVVQEKQRLLQQCEIALDTLNDTPLASQAVRALMFIERFEQDLAHQFERLDPLSSP